MQGESLSLTPKLLKRQVLQELPSTHFSSSFNPNRMPKWRPTPLLLNVTGGCDPKIQKTHGFHSRTRPGRKWLTEIILKDCVTMINQVETCHGQWQRVGSETSAIHKRIQVTSPWRYHVTWLWKNLMLWHKLLVLRAVDVCDCGRLAVIIANHKRVAWRRHCQELKNTFLLARTGLTSPLWYLERQIKRTTLARRILAKRWQAQQANLELICFKVFPMGKSASARASSRGVPLKGEMCWSPCGMGKLVTRTLPLKIARCFHLQLQYWHSTDNDATWLQNNPMSPTSITSDISGKDQFGKEFQIWFSDALSQNMGAINGPPV